IPGPVDVVVILVGPTQIPRLLDDCRSKGVRFAIALGDIVNAREAASSARLQELREKIAKGAPRIVGPVCVGVLAPYANLALTISPGMLAGSPPKGGIGLISQSGGVMSAVLDRAHQFGTGFSALVSSGVSLISTCATTSSTCLTTPPHTVSPSMRRRLMTRPA